MKVEISEEPISALIDYARIPIAFEVHHVLDIAERDPLILGERMVEVPWVKDYDAIAGAGPAHWAETFDLSNWGLIAARSRGRRVGGAVIAFNTPGVTMLDGRSDLAVLWDIRIDPAARGQGIGSALFNAVEEWAVARGCRELKIETQNINVAASRFYERQGCVLRAIRRLAYPDHPEEIQLFWNKDLVPAPRR